MRTKVWCRLFIVNHLCLMTKTDKFMIVNMKSVFLAGMRPKML